MFGKGKKVPVNTSTQDPVIHLAEAMIAQLETGNASNSILRQEAQGQQSFVNSDTLPISRGDFNDVTSKRALEAAGVKFGEIVQDDPIFQNVELPPGWKKVGTNHSMWSNLVDEKGRKRASIFYKAAFYDRSAHYNADRRYSTSIDYERQEKEGVTVGLVMDGNTVIHTTEPFTGEGEKGYELSSKAEKAAAEWLNDHFPNWRDPGAYWD